MSGKLDKAKQLVKAGHHSNAQTLLAEILVTDPANEIAWLWLASILGENYRRYCLRQVLVINPQNKQARSYLINLGENPEISGAPANAQIVRSLQNNDDDLKSPDRMNGQDVEKDDRKSQIDPKLTGLLDYWVFSRGNSVQALILDDSEISMATLEPARRKIVVERLDRAKIPFELFLDLEQVQFNLVYEVIQNHKHVQVLYDNDDKRKLDLYCADPAMGTAVVNVLSRKLGPRFERQITSVRFSSKILVLFVLFILVAVITAASFFGTIEITSGDFIIPISTRTLSTLSAIGPIGLLTIGMLIMLIIFISMVFQYLKPPKITKLVIDDSIYP